MGTKPQTSTLTMKTLSGIFEQPKMHHRRDFLRENKLNLRELQKSTTQKLTQQKEEQEKKHFKHIQKFQKVREQSLARRSASQNRHVGNGGDGSGRGRQSRMAAGTDRGGGDDMTKTMAVKAKSNCMPYKRALSQQRQRTENIPICTSCCCTHQQQVQNNRSVLQDQEQVPRSVSSVSVVSKTDSCDKEIQTEDISDEDFLYKALKKCSSSEGQEFSKQKSNDYLQDKDNNLQSSNSNRYLQQYESETKSFHSSNQVPYINHNNYESETVHRDYMEQHTARSASSHITNGHYQDYNPEGNNNNQHGNCASNDMEQNFQNLKLDDNLRTDMDPQTSARSRQTLCSTSTKRRSKLGCREDLRLPRYLEKEKREKEEEALRQMSKDPNCPSGHYALSETERLKILQQAQQKMSSLINELNHMPMTSETLRIRNRKQEIEKELTQIEMNIRLYSKSKVYVAESSPPIQY